MIKFQDRNEKNFNVILKIANSWVGMFKDISQKETSFIIVCINEMGSIQLYS